MNKVADWLKVIEGFKDIESFALLGHTTISLFAGIVLVSFWYHSQGVRYRKQDIGFTLLGGAMIVWAILGIWELDSSNEGPFSHIGQRLLSIGNSCLFLASLPHFEHGFERIRTKVSFFDNPSKWRNAVIGIYAIFFGASMFTFRSYGENEIIAGLPDTILSTLTIVALAYAIFMSFKERKVYSLSYLTIVVLMMLLIAQILGLDPDLKDEPSFYWLRLISHSLLSMLFLSLGFTWLLETYRENTKKVSLEDSNISKMLFVTRNKNEREGYIYLTWPSKKIFQHRVVFPNERFKTLILFAVKTKMDKSVDRENDRSFIVSGDIHQANRQIREAINNSLNTDKIFKKTDELFANTGTGKYKLKIEPSQILIDIPALKDLSGLKQILNELDSSGSEDPN